MRRNTTRIRLLILGAMTWLMVSAWIGFEVYHGYITDKLSEQYETEITTLNPSLNIEVLNKLSAKRDLPVVFPTYVPVPTVTPAF